MWPFTRPTHDGRERVQNGAVLLDVRTPAEFAAGHIDGALNIPVQELPSRVKELAPRGKSVVVYCRSGARSCAAAGILTAQGYEVLDIGGMGNW